MLALQADVEAVAVPSGSATATSVSRGRSGSTRRQHRVGGVGRPPRRGSRCRVTDAVQQAAGEDRHVEVRCLRPPSRDGQRPGLDGDGSRTRRSASVLAAGEAAEARVATAAAPRGSSGWSNRPSGSACQVSTSASGTGAPAPSNTVPTMPNAPGVPVGHDEGPSGPGAGRCAGRARPSGTGSRPAAQRRHRRPPPRRRGLADRAARCRTRRPAPTPARVAVQVEAGDQPLAGAAGRGPS